MLNCNRELILRGWQQIMTRWQKEIWDGFLVITWVNLPSMRLHSHFNPGNIAR